jgi:hypothetical protein
MKGVDMGLKDAVVGDTVTYRNAAGETFNATVIQTEPSTPAGGAWSVANSGTGGTLGAATYSYRIAKVQNGLVGPAATAKTTVVGAGTTNKCTITLPTDVGVGGVSYNIYGRTGGSELLIASSVTTATYDDTGSITPAGALPAATNGRVQLFQPTGGVPVQAAGVIKATALRGAGSTGVYMKR